MNIVSSRPQDSSIVISLFHQGSSVFSRLLSMNIDSSRPQDSSVAMPLLYLVDSSISKICPILNPFLPFKQFQTPGLLSCNVTLLPSHQFSCQDCWNILPILLWKIWNNFCFSEISSMTFLPRF